MTTRQIPLTCGKVALVDEKDFDRVASISWRFHPPKSIGNGYATGSQLREGKWRTIYLHRFLMSAPKGTEVDHINGDTLDCRRSNMRLATRSQNEANKPKTAKATSSRFKGVSWCGRRNRWRATIMVHQRFYSLGMFHSEQEAAIAYDKRARKEFGEFALTNFQSTKETA